MNVGSADAMTVERTLLVHINLTYIDDAVRQCRTDTPVETEVGEIRTATTRRRRVRG
jgi:hypothetical protein